MIASKLIIFRLCSWGTGIALSVISWMFNTENVYLWELTRRYNEIICLISLIPVSILFLVIESVRYQRSGLACIAKAFALMLVFILYAGLWAFFSGGV